MYGHWICEQQFDPTDYFGFVYLITHIESGRKYVGRKHFNKKRRKKVTGRKNRKIVITESDWKDYTSSSDVLNEDITRLGKDAFKFEILKLCKTRGELTYGEVEEQIKREVLTAKLPNGEREYYNNNIMARWFIGPEKRPDVALNNKKTKSEETRRKLSLARMGKPNPIVSESNKRRKGWNHSEKTKEKISIANSGHPGYWTGKSNPQHSEFMKLENQRRKQLGIK